MEKGNIKFMDEAVKLSLEKMRAGNGGPFGAVVVKNNKIISIGFNQVTSANDPTAHAEVVAIRKACQILKTHQLIGCELYTSCEPCTMRLGAIYWARPDAVYFSNSKSDAAKAGFDDDFIYQEMNVSFEKRRIPMINMIHQEAITAFEEWLKTEDKILY